MADPITSSQQQEVAVGVSTTVTTVVSTDTQNYAVPTLHLKLKKPKTGRKVQWTTETVDNEGLNKKKSKCCCIYKKPKDFDESSSSEDDSNDECDHCQGHVEKSKVKPSDATCTPAENGSTTIIIENQEPKKPGNPQSSDPPPP